MTNETPHDLPNIPMPGQDLLRIDWSVSVAADLYSYESCRCPIRMLPDGWRQVRSPGRFPGQPLAGPDTANAITSAVAGTAGRLHRPVLDLDVPHRYVPSTTPGHAHLLIDAPMAWTVYAQMLRALAVGGVIQRGFALSAGQRGYSAVALPGIAKVW